MVGPERDLLDRQRSLVKVEGLSVVMLDSVMRAIRCAIARAMCVSSSWIGIETCSSGLHALRTEERPETLIQQLGAQLRAYLATADWARAEQAIFDAAEQADRVHLTIRLGAAELYLVHARQTE